MINNSLFQEIKFVSSCESTNLVLNNILKEKDSNENIILRTDFQTKGVGQKGNYWESENGKNLLFSISIGFEKLLAVHQFYLSAIVSLSIVGILKEYLPNETISIKWPNDIYVGKKKIAGVLIENSLIGNRINRSIIGIGINVNQKGFIGDAPNPSSLGIITGNIYDLDSLLNHFITEFGKYYQKIKEEKFEQIKSEYLKILFQKDEVNNYIIEHKQTEGIIRGVDKFGFLSIEIYGQISSFDIKEVKYLV
jgi:BirA family biotin operon repressor/biotin-[acetyl-CoA-carboxylase] ligase